MNRNEFEYRYVSPTEAERREIEKIKSQYEGKTEKELKLERIRRLDSFVQNFSITLSLIIGIMGTLIFGLGFSMILVWDIIGVGIAVCVVGAVPIACAYPVYAVTMKRNKSKYGDEILRLSNEILNEKGSGK